MSDDQNTQPTDQTDPLAYDPDEDPDIDPTMTAPEEGRPDGIKPPGSDTEVPEDPDGPADG